MVRLVSVTLAIALAIGVYAASAQTGGTGGSKVQLMAGVVKAVSVSSLTLERGGNEIVFGLDASTRLLAKGRARDLLRRTPERRIADIVKPGDRVTVRFRQSGATMSAVEVRVFQK